MLCRRPNASAIPELLLLLKQRQQPPFAHKAYLSQVIQIDAVVGRAKSHQVAVVGAELHAAHVGLAVYAGHCRLIAHVPKAHCPVVAATEEACGVSLQAASKGMLWHKTWSLTASTLQEVKVSPSQHNCAPFEPACKNSNTLLTVALMSFLSGPGIEHP